MGERVAHVVSGQMIDYVEFEDGFAIVMTQAPPCAIDRSLAESTLRTHYGITVVGVKKPRQRLRLCPPETIPAKETA